jgi:predicted P-loop ATPase
VTRQRPVAPTDGDAAAGVEELWQSKLLMNDKGAPRAVLANGVIALSSAREWQGVLGFDLLAQRTIVRALPPWGGRAGNRPWTNTDDLRAADWLQHRGIRVEATVASQAVELVAHRHEFHPVRDYLKSLVWDGVARLDECPRARFGVLHEEPQLAEFAASAWAKWMISGVARVYRPGCKVDYMIVLESPQGSLKSSTIETLSEPWYTDELALMGSKDASEQLQGKWIIEISELGSISGSNLEAIKAFITRKTDRFRPSYGRRVHEYPRQCIFIGTTNRDDWNRDETGARRFWPLLCTKIDLGAIRELRDQLWAEARDRYLSGEAWWLVNGLDRAAADEQDARYLGDPWDEKIQTWAEQQTSNGITIPAVLKECIGKSEKDWDQRDQNRVARAFRRMGWEKFRATSKGGRDERRLWWAYRRPKLPNNEK